ncbi:hypothetical protein NE857_23290 [Nocardiopsis exhalans]|uniref:DUF4064 domain-containing protein n=1 Tax=Nocardiopsis exhalans TaxID=163604 RepID=A0ABY5D1I5_9ACTN|nr:hypothetical protein [Nocardiopsis exhalans]USY18227.1 hypothetical protein NE857_23290 [Nocardiopsis exhalans]
MYPQQPPQGPDEGGHDPYQQDPSGYPGQPGPYGNPGQQGPPVYPGTPRQPDKMPGTAITVRVLMFIGGAFGLLFGGLLLLVGLGLVADPETTQEVLRELQDSGLYIEAAELTALLGTMGGVMFGYGVISTALASFMGKRSAVVLWLIVVFQALASVTLMLGLVFGGIGPILPLIFTITMIVLMLVPPTRAFYTPRPPTPYTGY